MNALGTVDFVFSQLLNVAHHRSGYTQRFDASHRPKEGAQGRYASLSGHVPTLLPGSHILRHIAANLRTDLLSVRSRLQNIDTGQLTKDDDERKRRKPFDFSNQKDYAND